MPNSNDHDDDALSIHSVEDSIIANPEPIHVVGLGELLCATSKGVIGQVVQCGNNPLLDLAIQVANLLLCCTFNPDGVRHVLIVHYVQHWSNKEQSEKNGIMVRIRSTWTIERKVAEASGRSIIS